MKLTFIEILVIVCTIIVIVGTIGFGIAGPYFESQAYNKLTGANTTYWDAVWLELRVQDKPK